MYEIGKVYVWRNQTGVSAHINGEECVPEEPAANYRNILTGQTVWGQRVVNSDGVPWIAFRGDLIQKNPPPGEQSILDLLRTPQPETADV